MVRSVAELSAEVASRYAVLDLPSWPDPHPDMASPLEEEYSRVTDPARYRIVHARARVWATVLTEVLGAHAEVLASTPPVADREPGSHRGVRLVPRRPAALPLLLLERDVAVPADPAPLPVLDVAVVRPDVRVALQPDCGCDACDTGSEQLLEAVDSTISQIVSGPFVVLRHPTWQAQWHPEGGSAGGEGGTLDADGMFDLCRRLAKGDAAPLPRGTEAFVGRSWFG